jgi:probable aminopeptidase NPEPL1
MDSASLAAARNRMSDEDSEDEDTEDDQNNETPRKRKALKNPLSPSGNDNNNSTAAKKKKKKRKKSRLEAEKDFKKFGHPASFNAWLQKNWTATVNKTRRHGNNKHGHGLCLRNGGYLYCGLCNIVIGSTQKVSQHLATEKHYALYEMNVVSNNMVSISQRMLNNTTTFSLEEPTAPAHTTMLIGKRNVLQDLITNNNNNNNDTDKWDDEKSLLFGLDSATTAQAVLDSIDDRGEGGGGGGGGSASTFTKTGQKLVLAVLPTTTSRNNHAWSVHLIPKLVAAHLPTTAGSGGGMGKTSRIVFIGDSAAEYVGALTIAVSKAFAVYSLKTTVASRQKDTATMEAEVAQRQRGTVHVNFYNDVGNVHLLPTIEPSAGRAALAAACEGVHKLATRLMDMPPNQLTVDAYAAECQAMADTLGDSVTMVEIKGNDLHRRGYGGVYGVGKAAKYPPRVVILEYTPPQSNNSTTVASTAAGVDNNEHDNKAVALVTKCIFYDAGHLALMQASSPTGVCGNNNNNRMKADIVASAGVLGGFVSAVHAGYRHKLYFVLCLAENALTTPGAVACPNNIIVNSTATTEALRNGDVLQLYSRKTVEVCNANAHGRLLLADGVAHATRHFANLDLVIDMATLIEDAAAAAQTGAAGQAAATTTRHHAGILTNRQELEMPAVASGLRSGDLCFPMVYAPELVMQDLKSKVADMTNSASSNAAITLPSSSSACAAGHFIESHLAEDYKGGWLHIDTTGPATDAERSAGYGVGLVLSMLGVKGF